MSTLPMTPTYIHHGGYDEETRAHPVLKWLEQYGNEIIDGRKWDTPHHEHHHPDFWVQMHDGTVVHGAHKAWPLISEIYAPYTSHYHDLTFLIIAETHDGWTMVAQADLFANVHGAPGEPKVKDSKGKAWEVKSPTMFVFHFVKGGPDGILLKSTRIYGDTAPVIGKRLKKGHIKPEHLMR